MEAIWKLLDPVIEHLKGCDLASASETQESLSAAFPDTAALELFCRDHVDELCPREAGTTRFGRLSKDRDGFSVDAVLSAGRGMKHSHPQGEVNFCFAHEGSPKFDGHEPGWVVYGPGTTHPANVEGGAMFMIYFLPGGQIEWHKD